MAKSERRQFKQEFKWKHSIIAQPYFSGSSGNLGVRGVGVLALDKFNHVRHEVRSLQD